ncbi:hypothetical protein COLO4_29474 [Corchorus olitorius]|uniref:Uncharacterized protein n=1 Tax=Corchorus olitorius TaxID=93759 RepID=A0A1R3HEF2_9ROSI|nr:hypothetical protein COLO4_29474 [Corchorus olitorius]
MAETNLMLSSYQAERLPKKAKLDRDFSFSLFNTPAPTSPGFIDATGRQQKRIALSATKEKDNKTGLIRVRWCGKEVFTIGEIVGKDRKCNRISILRGIDIVQETRLDRVLPD